VKCRGKADVRVRGVLTPLTWKGEGGMILLITVELIELCRGSTLQKPRGTFESIAGWERIKQTLEI